MVICVFVFGLLQGGESARYAMTRVASDSDERKSRSKRFCFRSAQLFSTPYMDHIHHIHFSSSYDKQC